MNEEKMRILQMLSEGKISAEEAEELLEALEESKEGQSSDQQEEKSKWTRPWGQERWAFKKKGPKWTGIGKGIPFASEGPFEGPTERTIEVPGETELQITTGGGDVKLSSTQKLALKLRAALHQCKINKGERRVEISAGGTDLELEVPPTISSLRLSVGGGDISVEGLSLSLKARAGGGDFRGVQLKGAIEVHATGGDVKLENIDSPALEVATGGGDIDVTMGTVKEGRVNLRSVGGDVCLKLSPDSTFEVLMGSLGGDIHTDLPLEVVEKSEHRLQHRLKGRSGGGGAQISLSSKGGDVNLQSR